MHSEYRNIKQCRVRFSAKRLPPDRSAYATSFLYRGLRFRVSIFAVGLGLGRTPTLSCPQRGAMRLPYVCLHFRYSRLTFGCTVVLARPTPRRTFKTCESPGFDFAPDHATFWESRAREVAKWYFLPFLPSALGKLIIQVGWGKA